MFLGLDINTGSVYEGAGFPPDRPVLPVPMVLWARLIEGPSDWAALPPGTQSGAQTWVFREDSFDVVTRTRRGRIYQSMVGEPYPNHQVRVMPHAYEDPGGRNTGPDGKLHRPLRIYAAGTDVVNLQGGAQGKVLALGDATAASAWRILQAEVTFSRDVMLTLKALTAFGVLPDLDKTKVPTEFESDIDRALERAVNSAFRETAESVVDQCRNALTVVLSRWLVQRGSDAVALSWDLGRIAREVEGVERHCASWVARVVAKLHSRGKMNEDRALRTVTDEDAEFAVHILGFTLREIGWAK